MFLEVLCYFVHLLESMNDGDRDGSEWSGIFSRASSFCRAMWNHRRLISVEPSESAEIDDDEARQGLVDSSTFYLLSIEVLTSLAAVYSSWYLPT